MICKDSVLKWFKGLHSHNRIDLMCSLLTKCLPFELRFMGTCLEDLGRQHFTQMKDFEVKANNTSELGEFEAECIISDTRTRQKLALYVCLLHSLNTTCSTLIYKSLYGIDPKEVVSSAKNCDDKVLEELLTIYTVAVNHPAFSFEQRQTLGRILLQLQLEESRLEAEKLAESSNEEYMQSHVSTDAMDVLRPMTGQELAPLSAPPGMSYPPALNAGNFIQIPLYPSYPAQQMPPTSIVWQLINYQPLPGENLSQPFSPRISRHSSPTQSSSPSRTTSPVRKPYNPRLERSDSLPKSRHQYSEVTYANPPPVTKKVILEPKEGTSKIDEEIRGLSERVSDLATEDVLRTAAVNLNGIACPTVRPPHMNIRTKIPCPPPFDVDVPQASALPYSTTVQAGPIVPPGVCTTPIQQPPPRYSQPGVSKTSTLTGEDGIRNCSSSSGSDASSSSHSPPITPAATNMNWEKGYQREGTESEEAVLPSQQNRERPWLGLGRGRGRIGPPGAQTLPRERVPLASALRRDGPRSAPPTPQDDKKGYFLPSGSGDVPQPSVTTAVVSPATLLASTSSGKPMCGEMVAAGVPYATPFLSTPFTGPPMFPQFPPTFVRPPYSYPNGEVLTYAYQPQHQPPPFLASPHVTYSTSIPPPKIACYNCSSQSHHPNDCKEPTMEEYSSKGQYRIDYGKSNELLSSEK